MIYEVYTINYAGRLSIVFVGINITFSVSRNLFARVITLLLALGYGILLTPAEAKRKYRWKIILLSFFFVGFNVIFDIAVYENQIRALT